MQNNQKCFMHWPLVIPKIYNFGPILDQCWSKNFKTKLFPLQFYFLCYCNYMQQETSTHWLLRILEKPHFGPILNFKTMLFLIKSFASLLSLYVAVTSCKKSENFHLLNWLLIIPAKPHLGTILGPIWPKNLKKIFFRKKKIILVNFMLRCYYVLIYLLLL